MTTLVSAHNCIFGSRHLGIYASTLREWPSLEGEHECFFVIDDLVGHFTQPIDSHTYANKAMYVAKQFLQAGVKRGSIVLISEIPEIYELAILLASTFKLEDFQEASVQSCVSALTVEQRRQLGLQKSASTSEAFYPNILISSYIIGMSADIWQGGFEITSNYGLVNSLVDSARTTLSESCVTRPRLLLSDFHSVPAADNKYMTFANGLPIDESPEAIKSHVDRIVDWEVAVNWLRICGLGAEAEGVASRKKLSKRDKGDLTEALVHMLEPFRTIRVSNAEVLSALEHGTSGARERIANKLSDVKREMGVGSYLGVFRRRAA